MPIWPEDPVTKMRLDLVCLNPSEDASPGYENDVARFKPNCENALLRDDAGEVNEAGDALARMLANGRDVNEEVINIWRKVKKSCFLKRDCCCCWGRVRGR